jgi:hypothetical protein
MALLDPPDREKGVGRRCSIGCESWPDEPDYHECPSCGEPTTRYRNLFPLSPHDARVKRLHILFEEFYEDEWPLLRPVENPEMVGKEWLLALTLEDCLVSPS